MEKGIAQLSLNDDDAGVPEGQAGSSAASSKPRAIPDEEEEADLDDIMPGITAPAASSSSSSSVPAAKRKRDAPAFPSSSTSGKERKAGAASSVKYFEMEGETAEDLAAAYITADVRCLQAHITSSWLWCYKCVPCAMCAQAASQPSYETMGFHHQQQVCFGVNFFSYCAYGMLVDVTYFTHHRVILKSMYRSRCTPHVASVNGGVNGCTKQLMMTARIEAARKKDAVDFERKEASNGRRGSFVARFMGNKKKFEVSFHGLLLMMRLL